MPRRGTSPRSRRSRARPAGGVEHRLSLRGAAASVGRLAAGRLEGQRRLTLNLGVRYDVQLGVHSEKIELLPWLTGDLPHDLNNVAPRLGLRVQPQRPHGRARRLRTVLHAGARPTRRTRRRSTPSAPSPSGSTTAVPTSRPTRSTARRRRTRQVLATACDITGIRPGCLRRELTSEINHPWRQRLVLAPGVDRRAAADRHDDGGRGELRVHRRPRRGEHLQHQSELQPGDRHQLSVQRHQPAAVSRVGPRQFGFLEGLLQLSRPRDELHQAVQQSLAGVGHLHARRASGTARRRHRSSPSSTDS